MAHLPGLSEEEEKRSYELNAEIMNLDASMANINNILGYTEGDSVTIKKDDLEVIIKAALKYQKELLIEKNKYTDILNDNTKEPSFKI